MVSTRTRQEAIMSKGKVLVVGSNATRIEVQGGGWGPTGNYLNETVVPTMAVIDAGYDIVLATVNGTKPHLDEPGSYAARSDRGRAGQLRGRVRARRPGASCGPHAGPPNGGDPSSLPRSHKTYCTALPRPDCARRGDAARPRVSRGTHCRCRGKGERMGQGLAVCRLQDDYFLGL